MEEKKEKNEAWFSDPVYSHFGGYRMCLRVDASRNRKVVVEKALMCLCMSI